MRKLQTHRTPAVFALENYDRNGCTDSTDFTDSYGFFFFFASNQAGIPQKSVRIGEIRRIRTLYVCSEKEESSIFATKRSKEWI
ncbi:MAG: hypothetical protein RLZZ628_3627, partial [Bacteroidota bacterium]